MFGFFSKKNIVLYTPGCDGSEAIFNAIKKRARLRRVQVLSWKNLALLSVRADKKTLRSLQAAEEIIRHEMQGDKPLYFITVVQDPLARQMDMALKAVENKTPNMVANLVLGNSDFERKGTKWFEDEFMPATGIDIYTQNFGLGYAVYTKGAHKFLLLSAELGADTQQKIIQDFLGLNIGRIKARPYEAEPYLRARFAQSLRASNVLDVFYNTKEAKHLFTSEAIERFQAGLDIAPVLPVNPNNRMRDIFRAMATILRRQGHIKEPLALLNAAGLGGGEMGAALASEAQLMHAPYALPLRGAVDYRPDIKTVLYNPHQCLPCHSSGYATRTQGLVRGLKNKGWDMRVVARAGYPIDTKGVPPAPNPTDIEGVPYWFDSRQGVGQQDFPMAEYIGRAADYLVEMAKDMRPVIVHTASNYINGMAGIEAARRLGVPCIYEMRGLWHVSQWAKNPEYHKCDKFALAQKMELECAQAADHVLAITGALKEWLVEEGINANKISLTPNAVDAQAFAPLPYDAEFAAKVGCEGKIVIGYIGSFVGYEGLDLLLEAVARLPDDLRDGIKLLWVGDGPVLDDLFKMAGQLGIKDLICATGRIDFDVIPRAYSVVDIAVFPRKSDVVCEIISPLKPFEAMAMEKAVLVSSVRPLKEIIDHKVTGLIHEKDDVGDLANKLAELIWDNNLRQKCGRAAREWVLGTRQWDVIAGGVSEIYEGLIKG